MLLAPAVNGSVVAAEKDGRDGAAFELRGPCVLRVFEEAIGERLVFRGLRVPESAGHMAGDGVDQDHRGKLASGDDEITERDLLVHPSIDEAFVDAFIAAADKDEAGLTGEVTDEAIAEACRVASASGIVVPANRNCPGQTVISGEIDALENAMELAKGRGARRVARLNVSIASHSPLMADANAEFQQLLRDAALSLPDFPEKPSGMVIGNTTAQPLYTTGGLYEELDLQMERPVDWTGSIQTMSDAGVKSFIEIGPGNVLGSLIKRIASDAQTVTMSGLGLGIPTLTAR